jgi:acetyl esterase/lipase
MTRISRREALVSGLLLAGATLPVAARATVPANTTIAQDVLPLWPAGAPGGERVIVTEEVVERPHPQGLRDRIARGVRIPTLTAFLPRGQARAGVLVIPGGGYKHVVLDKEGCETAAWLATQGFAAFVLRYRLPGDGWAAGPDAPLQDAQRAMRLVRDHCERNGCGRERTAVLGFSAGGHLAARLATCFAEATYEPVDPLDAAPARPAATALLYPVITLTGVGVHAGSRDHLLGPAPGASALEQWSAQNGVTGTTSPTFIVHAADDDSVPLRNSRLLFDALLAAGVPVDLHVFARGGHGFVPGPLA